MTDWQETIERRLAELGEQKKRRQLRIFSGTGAHGSFGEGQLMLNLASNDYLGLAADPRLAEAQGRAARKYGAGAGASRLLTGNHPLYEEAEQAIMDWKQTEAALICGSGYMANVGVLTALLERHDLVYSDRLNHASIVDGIVLSRAELKRYRHNDMDHLESLLQKAPLEKRKLIVTDSVFSMDGDVANLTELIRLKEKYNALLIVDEAHAGGIYGKEGRGMCAELGVDDTVDIQIGTFSKAFGSCGAYVTGKQWMIDYLLNRMRSLIYTTALPPAVLGSIIEGIRIVRTEPERRMRLLENAALFRGELIAGGLDIYGSTTQIVPVRAGTNEQVLTLSASLQKAGIAAVAIRPPTVPAGEARIRFAVSAIHKEEELIEAAAYVMELAGKQIKI